HAFQPFLDKFPNSPYSTEVARKTAEWKSAMEQAYYQNTRRYELNPNESYKLDYYDHVITGVFQPFLDQFPHSQYLSNVRSNMADWMAARANLEQGKILFRGGWITPEEKQDIERVEYETSHRVKGLALYDGSWFSEDAVRTLAEADASKLHGDNAMARSAWA